MKQDEIAGEYLDKAYITLLPNERNQIIKQMIEFSNHLLSKQPSGVSVNAELLKACLWIQSAIQGGQVRGLYEDEIEQLNNAITKANSLSPQSDAVECVCDEPEPDKLFQGGTLFCRRCNLNMKQ